MKLGAQMIVCLAGCVALCAQAGTTGPGEGNPYRVIFERNVFDLKPPPPPVVPTNTPPPPPNVKLTGITTILGNKQALFMVSEAAQPGRPPGKEQSCILAEGERQGSLEVLEINKEAETVKISNDGTVSTITFDKPKQATPAPGAPGGGAPGFPGGGAGFMSPSGQQPAGGYRARNPYGANAANGGVPAAPQMPQMPQMPQFNSQTQNGQPMTPEERAALVRLYRSKLNQQNPAPPTPPVPGQ